MGISAESLKTLMNNGMEEPEHKAEMNTYESAAFNGSAEKRLEYEISRKSKNDDHIGTGEGNSGSAGNSFEKSEGDYGKWKPSVN